MQDIEKRNSKLWWRIRKIVLFLSWKNKTVFRWLTRIWHIYDLLARSNDRRETSTLVGDDSCCSWCSVSLSIAQGHVPIICFVSFVLSWSRVLPSNTQRNCGGVVLTGTILQERSVHSPCSWVDWIFEMQWISWDDCPWWGRVILRWSLQSWDLCIKEAFPHWSRPSGRRTFWLECKVSSLLSRKSSRRCPVTVPRCGPTGTLRVTSWSAIRSFILSWTWTPRRTVVVTFDLPWEDPFALSKRSGRRDGCLYCSTSFLTRIDIHLFRVILLRSLPLLSLYARIDVVVF